MKKKKDFIIGVLNFKILFIFILKVKKNESFINPILEKLLEKDTFI